MTPNLPMIRRSLHRLMTRRFVDIKSIASTERLLCAAESATLPPALYLEGALDKVKALSPWRSWDVERLLVEGGKIEHAASQAHVIRKVDIVDGYLYAGGARAQHGYGKERLLLNGAHQRVTYQSASLLSNNAGSHFFGNFLLDDFPLALLAEGRDDNIVAPTKHYDHELGYRELANLPRPPSPRRAFVRELTIFTDFAQNSLKAARYRTLRQRVRNALQNAGVSNGPGVFIRRGRTGEPRILANELEVEQTLVTLGFTVLDPSTMSARDIAARSLDAKIVVSVEGSHLSHAIFTVADDGAFLVLQPPERFAMAYKEFTDRLDMKFAFLVGDTAADGFTISMDELKRMLQKLL